MFNLLGAAAAAALLSTPGPVLAAVQDPVAAVTEAHTPAAEHSVPVDAEPVADLRSDFKKWSTYQDLPLVGHLVDTKEGRVVAVQNDFYMDKRDSASMYVSLTPDTSKAATFLLYPDVEGEPDGGFLLQVVQNPAAGESTNGWFVACHNSFRKDRQFEDYARVLVHSDRKKAGVWKFEQQYGNQVLILAKSRDSSGRGSEGFAVTFPSPTGYRASDDIYLGVSLGGMGDEDGIPFAFKPLD